MAALNVGQRDERAEAGNQHDREHRNDRQAKAKHEQRIPFAAILAPGATTAPRFWTTPSRNMNRPRLPSHVSTRPMMNTARNKATATTMISARLSRIHGIAPSKSGPPPPAPGPPPPAPGPPPPAPGPPPPWKLKLQPLSPRPIKNAQKPSRSHFPKSKGWNRTRFVRASAGSIGSVTDSDTASPPAPPGDGHRRAIFAQSGKTAIAGPGHPMAPGIDRDFAIEHA